MKLFLLDARVSSVIRVVNLQQIQESISKALFLVSWFTPPVKNVGVVDGAHAHILDGVIAEVKEFLQGIGVNESRPWFGHNEWMSAPIVLIRKR